MAGPRFGEDHSVEFLDDTPRPDGSGAPNAAPGRRRAPVVAAWCGAAVLALGAIALIGRDGAHRPAAVPPPVASGSTSPAPSPFADTPPPDLQVPDWPSAAIAAAVAAHVPGAQTIFESTVTAAGAGGRVAVRRRQIRAISGNVQIDVVISTSSTARPTETATVFVERGYTIAFSFIGIYPPTPAQLSALAADPRLIAV